MRLRHAWVVALVLVPISTWANDHSADMNLAVSYNDGSALWGPYISLGLTPTRNPRLDRVSAVGDISFHVGDNDAGLRMARAAFSIGGRVWATSDTSRNRLFGQLVYTRVRDEVAGVISGNNAMTAAIGYEFHLRATPLDRGLATRVQVDYLLVNNVKNSPRVSVGLVYRVE